MSNCHLVFKHINWLTDSKRPSVLCHRSLERSEGSSSAVWLCAALIHLHVSWSGVSSASVTAGISNQESMMSICLLSDHLSVIWSSVCYHAGTESSSNVDVMKLLEMIPCDWIGLSLSFFYKLSDMSWIFELIWVVIRFSEVLLPHIITQNIYVSRQSQCGTLRASEEKINDQ